MIVIWSSAAIADLTQLRAHIENDNSAAAQRVALDIAHSVDTLLPANPQSGRPGRVPGTRELVIPKTPFIVPYRIVNGAIEVLRVYHGARRWPEQF
jgi:toxin ParE1/3/4